VRPDGNATLSASSVQKKLKDKRFAATVDRSEVHAGAAVLAVDLTEHIEFVIGALVPHADELRLAGR
jgi:predicted hydrolase (HD superfamily)